MNIIDKIKGRLKKYPELTYKSEGSHITIDPLTDSGFSVYFSINNPGFTVGFDGWHDEFENECDALDAVAFGLSDQCRLKVSKRGNTSYKWALESRDGEQWKEDSATGLLFYPFWRRKSVEYRQNGVIKATEQDD